MTFSDAVQLALRNLSQAKLRTSLTVMGVSIGSRRSRHGVARRRPAGSVRRPVDESRRVPIPSPWCRVTVSRGPFGPGGRGGLFAGRAAGPARRPPAASDKPSPTLDDDAVKRLAALAEVREVYPNLQVFVTVKYGGVLSGLSASGVPMSARDQGAFQTWAAGGFFANESDNAVRAEPGFREAPSPLAIPRS